MINTHQVLENNKKVNKSIIKKTFTVDSIFRPNYDNPNNRQSRLYY